MTGFEIAMLVQVGGSILGAFTSKREKQPISFEEKRYNRLRSEYTTLAKQFKVAQNTAAAFTGRPVSDFKGAVGARTMFKILERRGWKMEDADVSEKPKTYEPPIDPDTGNPSSAGFDSKAWAETHNPETGIAYNKIDPQTGDMKEDEE